MIYITKDMINKAKTSGYAYSEILEKNKTNPFYLILYAQEIVRGRCLECEKKLLKLKDPKLIYLYAAYVIKGRWKEAEDIILNSNEIKYLYLYTFNFYPKWKEAEKILLEKCDINLLWLYNKFIKNFKWKKLDKKLINKDLLREEETFSLFNIYAFEDKNKKWKIATL